nr:cyclic nucleotide-gated ion channel 1-like [Quercus suber]
MAESLNKGILPEIVPTDPDICRQQWPHEDHWEMPNPLIGYDDPYYHNHDLDDVDEEWNGVEAGDQQSVIDGRDSLERSSSSLLDHEQHHRILQTWRIIFGVSCVIAVSLDPLFFYVPVINEENKCIELDKKLRTISLILRSVTDIIGIINIILQVLNGYTDKTSGEDFDPNKTPRWWQLYFLIDILVLLPFPQVKERFLQLIWLYQ